MFALAVDGKRYLKEGRELVDFLLEKYLPDENSEPKLLNTAMRYSVMAGGKRLRPVLCMATYEYCDGRMQGEDLPIHFAMAALEMVHTYSLIHDDLPCMDDDDLRRGIPTCHKQFNEAVAVLAGDALHDIAFEFMVRANSMEAILELAHAIGTEGMLGGQMADIQAEGREVNLDEVVNIHRRKTGSLIHGSVRIGAIIAGADARMISRLTTFGEKVGLAFQIIDDILDIDGDQELLGKETGSDSRKKKATYPGVTGLVRAREDALRLIDEAVSVLDRDNDNALKAIATLIGQRQS